MRTQETCTILIETDFLSVRTFFFFSTLLHLQTLPIPSPSKNMCRGCSQPGPITHAAFLALQMLSLPRPHPPPPGAEPVKTLAGAARTGAGLGRGETKRKGGLERNVRAPAPPPPTAPTSSSYLFPCPGSPGLTFPRKCLP